MKKLSEKLHYYFFEEERLEEEISISNIFALTEERLFGFPLAFIAFFGMFPIPGVSVFFGTVMLSITLQLCTGQTKPWVPQKVLQKTFPLSKLQALMTKLIPWIKRIEKVSKPRLTFICHNLIGRIILGIILSIMAFIVVLPIPGANSVPSFAIFLAAIGLQEDDGVLAIAGMLVGLAFAAFLLVLLWTGSNLFEVLKLWFFSTFA